MTENEHYDAYADLGGQGSEPSAESARAMLSAGMGGARERRIVRDAERQVSRTEYADRHLSGVAERTPEQEANLQDFKLMHLADTALKAVESGMLPTEVAARNRARAERRKRGY